MKARNLSRLIGIVVGFLGAVALAQGQTIWHVNLSADPCDPPSACGTIWQQAFVDLQDALNAARPNQSPSDQIWVAAGTYYPGASQTDTFQLKSGVEVYGGFNGTETNLEQRDPETNVTILSGEIGVTGYADNCLTVVTGPTAFGHELASLDGFTVVAAARHAIHLSNSSPTLENLQIIDNRALDGAGLDWSGAGLFLEGDSAPQVTQCIFSGNQAMSGSGGGVYCGAGSEPRFDYCRFVGNSAGDGGGLYNASAAKPNVEPRLQSCVFDGNSASASGGGLFNLDESLMVVRDSVFINNSATSGAGAATGLGIFTACVFSRNQASAQGGGIWTVEFDPATQGPAVLSNCRIAGNESTQIGGGVQAARDVDLINCLVAGNLSGSGGGMASVSESHPNIYDSTFRANKAVSYNSGGGYLVKGQATIVNSIFWENRAAGQMTEAAQIQTFQNPGVVGITYTCVQGLSQWANPEYSNIGDNPAFVAGVGGAWTANAVYDQQTGMTTLVDSAAGLEAGALVGRLLNPDQNWY